MKFLRLLLPLVLVLLSSEAATANISAQQLEQIKQLPKEQQKALAKEYGFDLSTLSNNQNTRNVNPRLQQTVEPNRESKLQLPQNSYAEQFKPKLEELEPFGYELFAGEPTTFSPSELAPIPDSYLIGVGDTIKVNLYGKKNAEYELQVDRGGRLAIPQLSPIHVVGLSFKELKAQITKKISEEIIGVQAFVSMGELSPIRIMVVGESYKPGSYTVSPLATVTHALFVSGGVSDRGSLRKIQVKRGGKLVTTFDLYDLLLFGDSSKDVVLKPGDVVFIPPVSKRIEVKGEVNRQAIFELLDSDTLENVMAMTGGFKANAHKRRVIVSRFNESGKKVTLNYDFTKANQYQPRNGDEVVVHPVSERMRDTVTVVGAVTNPGNYQWQPGTTVQDIFSSPREDLLSIADFDYSLIIREMNIEGEIEVHQFSLRRELDEQTNGIELQPNDTILVFSRYRWQQDEEQALNDLAYKQEQLALRENIKLWENFKREEFLKFIGFKVDESELEEDEVAPKNIDSLLQNQESIGSKDTEKKYATFSREKLLAPVTAKLQRQASLKQPVKLFLINGQVKYPGLYPIAVGAGFSQAIKAAGGLNEAAYLEKVELTRVVYQGEKEVEHLHFDGTLEQSKPTLKLQSKDTINVFPKPNWQERLQVKVKGEVMFPGTYTIKRGESLESLLSRVGGLTKFAHKEGAIFTRESIKSKEKSQIESLTRDLRREIVANTFQKSKTANTSMSYDEMDKVLNDLSKVEALGRLVIDLDQASTRQMKLEDGDALYIPAQQNSISVVGEVYLSATHLYDERMSLSSYIEASGGYKKRADEDRVYIIKANGSVVIPNQNSWFAVNEGNDLLAPGDTIVVPLDTQHVDQLTLWSTATQILYQLGLAAASIVTLSNN